MHKEDGLRGLLLCYWEGLEKGKRFSWRGINTSSRHCSRRVGNHHSQVSAMKTPKSPPLLGLPNLTYLKEKLFTSKHFRVRGLLFTSEAHALCTACEACGNMASPSFLTAPRLPTHKGTQSQVWVAERTLMAQRAQN